MLVDETDVHVSGDDPAQQGAGGQDAHHGHEDSRNLVRQILNGSLQTRQEDDADEDGGYDVYKDDVQIHH